MSMMSRRSASAGAALSRRQDEALASGGLRLVRTLGPAAFVLLEEDGPRAAEHRVFLGNPHSCTCAIYVNEKDLCKHICWLLLKKFKVPRDHNYALQLGLVEREMNDMLQGLHITSHPRVTINCAQLPIAGDGYITQKDIETEDVCPICLDTLLKKMLPVTYCRFGCGNNIHIECMKIWADHQKELQKDSLVKCPLCREDFAPLQLILEEFRNCKRLVTAAEKQPLDKHLGIPCNNCRVCPIEGNCYKCIECSEYHLCQGCFKSFCHPSHDFTFREKRNQKWKSVEPAVKPSTSEHLQSTDLEQSSEKEKKVSCVPEQIIKLLPTTLVRNCSSLLDLGLQCRLCLKRFCTGQMARSLPCEHKFHRNCVDHWLQKENACPIDRQAVYNSLTWEMAPRKDRTSLLAPQVKNSPTTKAEQQLFIPGTGLFAKQMKPGRNAEKTQTSGYYDKKTTPSESEQNSGYYDKKTTPSESEQNSGYYNKKTTPSESEQNLTLAGIRYISSTRDSDSHLYRTPKATSLRFSRHMKGLVLIPKPEANVLTQKSIGVGLRGLSVQGNQ